MNGSADASPAPERTKDEREIDKNVEEESEKREIERDNSPLKVNDEKEQGLSSSESEQENLLD